MPTTVVIIDDHAPFRASARRLLELDDYTVVGEAEDGSSGLELVARLRPALALVDIGLPDTSGFSVAERLAGGPTRVVLVSSRGPKDVGARVRTSGAAGFVTKEALTATAIAGLLEAP